MKKLVNNVLGVTLAVSCVFPMNLTDNVLSTSVKAKEKNLNNSLVSYYSFDNESAIDEGKSGRNGTVDKTKASFTEKGKSGKALHVTTASKEGAVRLPKHTQNDRGDWTVSYWVKADQLSQPRIAVMADESKTRSFNLRIDNDELKGGLRVGPNKPDKLTFQKQFEANIWYNIAWTQDKNKGISLYVDGQHIQTMKWTSESKNTFVAPLDIIGAEGFTGEIDEVKFFNKVLNQGEITEQMRLKGLNLNATSANVVVDRTYQITTDLVSDNDDKEITFTSNDESIATVNNKGLVTAKKPGITTITVENKAGGFRENVTITVKVNTRSTISRYVLPENHLSVIEDGRGTKRQYLGQPDMVRTKTGRLITVYPVGHGHGPLVMQISDNDGETWTEKKNIPTSWANSQETPTMYKLNLKNGKERIMLITACPGRWGDHSTGWNTSYSDDNGETWTEYKHWYSDIDGKKNEVIVGMASLIQLKDDNGNFKQEWMAVYHNFDYVNHKTILTFDENGNEHWSKPVPYLDEHRDEEFTRGMCEIGMFRSPDGKRIVGLARSDKKTRLSSMIYSDDEGKTWSKPVDLPGSLSGERHKAIYDPISGRLVIAYREIDFDRNEDGILDPSPSQDDWMAGEWIAWVGSYEQLMNQEQGDYNIELCKDYAQNRFSGDTGYTGMVVLDDGTFVMDSYGHWDEAFSKAWRDHGAYNVKTDLSYIKQAKFKLGDIESKYGLVNYDKLTQYVNELPEINGDKYTKSTYDNYKNALDKANEVLTNRDSQQIQVNQALDGLKETKEKLVVRGDVTELAGLVENNSDRIQGDYKVTQEEWTKFTDALASAEAIVNDNSDSTQDDVDTAKLALEKEVQFLEQNKYHKEDMTPIDPSINIGDLKDAIAKKPAKDKEAYTSASWNVYQEALVQANETLTKENATQDEIDAATKALKDAYNALKENPGLTPLEPSTPIDPESKPDTDGNKPVNPDGEKPSVPTKPGAEEKPEDEAVENEETPSTGVSTNAAILWTMVLGAGYATIALANKKRKIQR